MSLASGRPAQGGCMIKKASSFHSTGREASRFHQVALPFFHELGFSLVDDPNLILSPYQQTRVTYKNRRGIFVACWFEPADGNFARVEVGRQWKIKESGLFRLSNDFYLLAAHHGIQLPRSYRLGVGNEVPKALEKMFGDLESTLPTLVEKVRLSDLEKIEEEKFGALVWAKTKFGAEYQAVISISEFGDFK